MSESKLFKKLKRATPGFHWQRHEDKFVSGIPDCSFGHNMMGGWVELKTYDHFPRNPEDPVRFHDLKPTQVNWAIARGSQSGDVWFLVAVSEAWFLIPWNYARKLGKLNRRQLEEASDAFGEGAITAEVKAVLAGV